MNAAGGEFWRGLHYVGRGARLLRRPGLRRYLIVPVLTNLLIFAAAGWLLLDAVRHLVVDWLPASFEWLRYVLVPLAVLVFALGFFFLFSFVANLLATPFNGALSAAVLRELRGHRAVPPLPLLEELRRGLVGELAKAAYLLKLTVPCVLLLLIPGLNLAGAVVWPLLGAWALAIEYLDCVLGNQLQPFPAALRVARTERSLACGFGTGLALLTAVPFLNFIAMPVGVAAATLLCHERRFVDDGA